MSCICNAQSDNASENNRGPITEMWSLFVATLYLLPAVHSWICKILKNMVPTSSHFPETRSNRSAVPLVLLGRNPLGVLSSRLDTLLWQWNESKGVYDLQDCFQLDCFQAHGKLLLLWTSGRELALARAVLELLNFGRHKQQQLHHIHKWIMQIIILWGSKLRIIRYCSQLHPK